MAYEVLCFLILKKYLQAEFPSGFIFNDHLILIINVRNVYCKRGKIIKMGKQESI